MLTKPVTLEVDDLSIAGRLYLPDSRRPHPTVCVCHGIPAGPPDPKNSGYPSLAERVCGEGLAAFIFNFRGTGASGGNLDMQGWAADLKAVVDFLWDLPEVDRSSLALLGFSGGAAVSVYIAAQDKRLSSVDLCLSCPV